MATYQGIRSLSNISWLKVFADYRRDEYKFCVEHRGVFIWDALAWEHEKSYPKVIDLIVSMQKAVNYYLDAIWC